MKNTPKNQRQILLSAIGRLLDDFSPSEIIKILDENTCLMFWGHANNFGVSTDQSELNHSLKKFFWTIYELEQSKKEAESSPKTVSKIDEDYFDFLPNEYFTDDIMFSEN